MVTAHVQWPRYHRLINSAFPPIDLFEDIADPADWPLLAQAEARTNPRIAETIGNLDLVPPDRRVSGPGASWVMAPFTHVSPDWQGRFHDGTFGAFYAADTFDCALFEVAHHAARFYAATQEPPGWIADKRELSGRIDAWLDDIRTGHDDLLHHDDYRPSQAFARTRRADGSDGILYPSVRFPGGTCFAAFWPDVPDPPVQGRHIACHWDGARIDMIKDHGSRQVLQLVP